jgi:hypothetical protein
MNLQIEENNIKSKMISNETIEKILKVYIKNNK